MPLSWHLKIFDQKNRPLCSRKSVKSALDDRKISSSASAKVVVKSGKIRQKTLKQVFTTRSVKKKHHPSRKPKSVSA